ncbi:MAG TPA: hypothetical protein VFS67_20775 [Polyangiaceae bacterium]|jgi:hypothetical protein|nr:hypothetical protein [Polyangiaceae bacterium]
MQQHQFEGLAERLLRGGIAPRHVRRYLRELSEHHEDLVRAELARGVELAAARAAASARLGTEESLAQSMLERPELRSKAARFPALVFGLGPVLSWLAAAFLIAIFVSLLPESSRHAQPSAALLAAVQVIWLLFARALPVLLGSGVLVAAARRRMSLRWAVAGSVVVDVLAGTLVMYVEAKQIGISSSLLPWLAPSSSAFGPRELGMVGKGLLTGAVLLGSSLLIERIARRFDGFARRSPVG